MVYKKRIKENVALCSGLLTSFNFSVYNMYYDHIISLENGLIKLYSHKLKYIKCFKYVQLMIFQNMGKCKKLGFFLKIHKKLSKAKLQVFDGFCQVS